ncbi:mannan chain length control protein LmeA [soil metagenome]
MRALLIAVLVLLGLAIAADRVLVVVSENLLADTIQDEGQLPAEPDISIEGFPFLPQAITGRYESVRVGVDVEALGLPPGATANIQLQGARVPLGSLLSGSVSSVPVDKVVGMVTFPFDYIGEQLGGATVTRDGSGLRVETTVSVLGRDFPVAATAELSLVGREVALTATNVEGFGTELPDGVTSVVLDLLDISLPVPELPFGLVFTGIEVVGDGMQVIAEGSDIVLEDPA